MTDTQHGANSATTPAKKAAMTVVPTRRWPAPPSDAAASSGAPKVAWLGMCVQGPPCRR